MASASRKHRIETTLNTPSEKLVTADGTVVYDGPIAAVSQSVCERQCQACGGWEEVRGVYGSLAWMAVGERCSACRPKGKR